MKKKYLIISLFIIVHFLSLVKFKFTAWPEMILWPYLLTKGWLPYKDIAIVHTPNLIFILTWFYKLFGVGIFQLQVFTWFLILTSDLLLFFIAKKIWNINIASWALLTYVFLQLFFDGNGLWFDLALVPLSLLIFYLTRRKKFFLAMLVWSLMFFTKQTAVWFLLPITIAVFSDSKNIQKNLIKGLAGLLFGVILETLPIINMGILANFYKWAIEFGIFILPRTSGQIQLPSLHSIAISMLPFVVFFPLIIKKTKRAFEIALWCMVGVLGAYPRFEYFHLQPALPFLSIAWGIYIASDTKTRIDSFLFPIFILICISIFASYFMANWGEGIRFYSQDVQDVIAYVTANTKPNDKIFVMNYWDNVYALTQTLPASDPWVPQLSWYMEIPGIQDQIVRNLMLAKPNLLIIQSYSETGLAAYIPTKIYNFVNVNYRLKEKVDGLEILTPKLK